MDIKNILDAAVSTNRFSINDCIDIETILTGKDADDLKTIRNKLSPTEYKSLKQSLIRNSFLIEPVNDNVTSTKVETRWSKRLLKDVRYASFETCYHIFSKLLGCLTRMNDNNFFIIKGFLNNSVIPYELPIDYTDRFAKPIHTPDNIDFFLNETVRRCISLREYIKSNSTPAGNVFRTILNDKIKVKTYLTDRALTGAYKTNREKRWEAHPNSVQYALRRDCMKIETKLLLQAAMFNGCYKTIVKDLQDKGLLRDKFNYCKCPITGDEIQYSDFEDDVLHPTHGKSRYQVGHLNPLKAVNDKSISNGHTADNISWISEDGNRIQGSLSIKEVNNLLKRIYSNRPELHG